MITGLSTVETGALGEENFYANTGEADTRLHPLSFRAYFKTNKQNHKTNPKKPQQCLNLLIRITLIKSNGKPKQRQEADHAVMLPHPFLSRPDRPIPSLALALVFIGTEFSKQENFSLFLLG